MRLIVMFCLLTLLSAFLPAQAVAGEVRTIVIDAGHGGYDLGIRNAQVREKDVALSLARMLQRAIEDSGRFAYLAREVDHYMTTEERREKANGRAPDIFLSLHLSGAEGINIYVTWFDKKDAELSLSEYYDVEARQRRYLHESSSYAYAMAMALREAFAVNVYVKEMSLPLLESIGAPAIMVEMPSSGIVYKQEGSKMVEALLIGIKNYERQ